MRMYSLMVFIMENILSISEASRPFLSYKISQNKLQNPDNNCLFLAIMYYLQVNVLKYTYYEQKSL